MKKYFCENIAKLMPKIIREFHFRMRTVITNEQLILSDIVILEYLREKKVSNMGEIASVLQLTMGRATGIVDDMIKRKFIKRERDVDDRRIVKVCLLSKGEEIAKKIQVEREESIDSMFSVLTDEEKKIYCALLTKIYESIGEKK